MTDDERRAAAQDRAAELVAVMRPVDEHEAAMLRRVLGPGIRAHRDARLAELRRSAK